jgi:raffinose/stachyose/melibiose transport system substrate-binding protein
MNGIRKAIGLAAAIAIAFAMSVDAEGSAKAKTDITILIGKPEIVEQLDLMVAAFNASHPDINATIVPLANQNMMQKLTVLYASKNVPTILNMSQEFPSFKDKLLDLSRESWVKHAFKGTLDTVTEKGKVLGMPMTVEAFGLLYNKDVLDKAVGKFDPSSIKTRADLEHLIAAVEKSMPQGAVHVSPMDWSLGAHFTNVLFADQSSDQAKRLAFLDSMKAGKVDLQKNALFNGWLDTFDLLKAHNANKASPLAPVYDDGVLALASGKVGFWFMGNWALPNLREANPKGTFGFLPVPISNSPTDYGNAQISVGVPAYWTIDASLSTPAQQDAAKIFLNWLVSSDEGQDFYVNKFSFIPVFDDFRAAPKDALSVQIVQYMKEGKTLEWMNNRYPADGWPTMGALMQKYLGGVIDRKTLAKGISDYWKSVK